MVDSRFVPKRYLCLKNENLTFHDIVVPQIYISLTWPMSDCHNTQIFETYSCHSDLSADIGS